MQVIYHNSEQVANNLFDLKYTNFVKSHLPKTATPNTEK